MNEGERPKSQSALTSLSATTFQSIIQDSSLPIFFIDETLKVTYANKAWYALLSIDSLDHANEWLARLDDASANRVVDLLGALSESDWTQISDDKGPTRIEVYLQKNTGLQKVALFIVDVLRVNQERDVKNESKSTDPLKWMVCYMIDVTSTRQDAEQRIKSLSEQLEKSRKVERQQSLYIKLVSYHLRQPHFLTDDQTHLQLIKRSLEELLQTINKTDDFKGPLHDPNPDAILGDFDSFSRYETYTLRLNKSPLQLKKILDDAYQSLPKLIQRQVQVSPEIWVMTDPVRLRYLMVCLIKLSDLLVPNTGIAPGESDTRTEETFNERSSLFTYTISFNSRSLTPSQVMFLESRVDSVSSSSLSFTEDDNVLLFLIKSLVDVFDGNMYYRYNSNSAGSGSNGNSSPGPGTCTIDITLPMTVTTQRQVTEAPQLFPSANPSDSSRLKRTFNRQIRVLVVEDNKLILQIQQKIIEKDGHFVMKADNGKAALDLFSKNAFDIVFVDVEMPVMDGLELTTRIRQQERAAAALNHNQAPRHVPIIIITGNKAKDYENKAKAAGATVYVTKPVEPYRFQAYIEKYVQD